MIGPAANQAQLKKAIEECIGTDQSILDVLWKKTLSPLKNVTRRIQSRAKTLTSLPGTDGDNNQLQFDLVSIQLVRVVDSST